MPKTASLTITRPDDWHVHVRDGDMLRDVIGYTARQFGRAIIMPNLVPPITTVKAAKSYKSRILAALPKGAEFEPLITAYLTNSTAAREIELGYQDGIFVAAKLYPAGATTNSENGVTDVKKIQSVLEIMQKLGMPLLVHGEVTDGEIDIFDREAVFIERVLIPLIYDFPELKIVFEHITTKQAVDFVIEGGKNIAATITPHHLYINRSDIFKGGINPHLYCLPIAKRERHRLALRRAATSGSAKFFLGTDSAPHIRGRKESACGCAGVFNAPFALESYVQVFDDEGALDKFEAFASVNGAVFYGLAANKGKITLKRAAFKVPEALKAAGQDIIPFHAGEMLNWQIEAEPS